MRAVIVVLSASFYTVRLDKIQSCLCCQLNCFVSVAEWLGRRTWNPEVAGSSPALTTKLELFLGGPQFNSSVMLVNK